MTRHSGVAIVAAQSPALSASAPRATTVILNHIMPVLVEKLKVINIAV